jgi:hypothetical protein
MPTTLETAVAQYLRSGNPAQRTREENSTTLRMWNVGAVDCHLPNLDEKRSVSFSIGSTRTLPHKKDEIQDAPRTRFVRTSPP